jgi:hypothetical protein
VPSTYFIFTTRVLWPCSSALSAKPEMKPSFLRMAAMPSLSFECGEWHSSRRALLALRRRVRKSLIGSVLVDVV